MPRHRRYSFLSLRSQATTQCPRRHIIVFTLLASMLTHPFAANADDLEKKRADCFRSAVARNFPRALKACDEALRLDPRNPELHSNKGSINYMLGAYDEALASYNAAIVLAPGNANHFYNRATLYDQLRRYDAAIQDYTVALALNPQLGLAYYNRAQDYAATGDEERAIADYRLALPLVPQFRRIITERLSTLGANPH